MNAATFLLLTLVVLITTGCATERVQVEPSKITLETALVEVATGLNKMYETSKDHPKSGLFPSEITVSFNISAKGEDSTKLYVEAGATVAEALKVAKIGAEGQWKIEAARGNGITIKFTNILFAPKDSFSGSRSPDDVKKIIEIIRDLGYVPPLTR